MDAFDSDALIYAIDPNNPLGRRVAHLFSTDPASDKAGIGSTLLSFEVLVKPKRTSSEAEAQALDELLDKLTLYPADESVVSTALDYGVRYGLKLVDAVHLAAAVAHGVDRFVTNNRADFPRSITEIEVCYLAELAA